MLSWITSAPSARFIHSLFFVSCWFVHVKLSWVDKKKTFEYETEFFISLLCNFSFRYGKGEILRKLTKVELLRLRKNYNFSVNFLQKYFRYLLSVLPCSDSNNFNSLKFLKSRKNLNKRTAKSHVNKFYLFSNDSNSRTTITLMCTQYG